MSVTEHDRANIGRIMGGYGDWFTAELLRLCAKADNHNRARLRLAFPEHVALYEEWYAGPKPSHDLPADYADSAE